MLGTIVDVLIGGDTPGKRRISTGPFLGLKDEGKTSVRFSFGSPKGFPVAFRFVHQSLMNLREESGLDQLRRPASTISETMTPAGQVDLQLRQVVQR